MITNYLKIALRNLRRQKLYSGITISGLAVGLSAAILIILFVADEFSFDRFNHSYNRIGRLITTSQSPNKNVRTFSLSPGNLGQRFKEEYSDVEDYTTIIDAYSWGRFTVEHGENKYYESQYLITEPSFFRLFDFTVLKGNKTSLLSKPNEMVLTESAARRLFGTENPIGKTITTDRSWGDFKVTGIVQDPPVNSHLRFDMLISMKSLEKLTGFQKALNTLDISIVRTYLLFTSNDALQNFPVHLKEFQERNKGKSFGVTDHISLQPLSDIHFHSQHIEFDLNNNARSETTIYILGVIGFLIIVIAAINYTNLSAAKSMNRMKEIGVRKVVGAGTGQLIAQFLTESVLISTIALSIALFLVELVLPAFNSFTGKTLSLFHNPAIGVIVTVITLTLFIGVLSGILPALLITKFKTILVLKGNAQPKNSFSLIGKGLVVAQFVVSIAMIFCTLTIYRQMEYIRSKDLGFRGDNMLIIDINSSGTRNNFETMKNEFAKSPNVKSVSVSSRIPGDWKNISQVRARTPGETAKNERRMYYIGSDHDFLNTFGITLMQGRNFSNTPADSSNILVNAETAAALGFDEPVGKTIVLSNGNTTGEFHVIGVVKDFNFQSLHEKISPMIIGYRNNPFIAIDYFAVRIDGRNIPQTIAYLKSVQDQFDTVTPFEYNFLDTRLEDFYRQDEREQVIVNVASGLALCIGCLGLFGLAAFSAEKRTKEIGVRKVLGASAPGLVVLFSGDFLKYVLVANLLSFPIAYYAMQLWLDGFAYRISIGIMTFVLSAALSLLVSFTTISFQAIKSAQANPAHVLKYE